MADKQISELTENSISSNDDCFMYDDKNGYTYKITYEELASALLQTSLDGGTGINIEEDQNSEIFKVTITVDADDTPTQDSSKPVKSSGVASAITSLGNAMTSMGQQLGAGLTSLSNSKQDKLTFDSAPTQNSSNPVTSGGVYTALQNISPPSITIDSTPTEHSTNAVSSGGVYSELASINTQLSQKQNALAFDTTPTENSTNPVTSGGVYTAIQNSGGGGGGSSWIESNAIMHRNLYRGQLLGTQPTTAQKAAIVAGTFDGMYCGDYWQPNDHTKIRIVDFNYWANIPSDEPDITTPHLALVVEDTESVGSLSTGGSTIEAITDTTFYTTTKNTLATAYESLLGGTIAWRPWVERGETSYEASCGSEKVTLLSQRQVYGTQITPPKDVICGDNNQLAAYQLNPALIPQTLSGAWLEDIWMQNVLSIDEWQTSYWCTRISEYGWGVVEGFAVDTAPYRCLIAYTGS